MKKHLLLTLSFILSMLLCLGALTSCGEGISGDEAKATTTALFEALSAGSYEEAAALFHPDTLTNAQNLSDYCAGLLNDYGIDVSKGMSIEKYTGFSSSMYDSTVGGARDELTMPVTVGDKICTFTTEVVRTDTGYGLINLHYNP